MCPGILDPNSCPENQRGRITRQLPKPKNEVWGETWQKPRPTTPQAEPLDPYKIETKVIGLFAVRLQFQQNANNTITKWWQNGG